MVKLKLSKYAPSLYMHQVYSPAFFFVEPKWRESSAIFCDSWVYQYSVRQRFHSCYMFEICSAKAMILQQKCYVTTSLIEWWNLKYQSFLTTPSNFTLWHIMNPKLNNLTIVHESRSVLTAHFNFKLLTQMISCEDKGWKLSMNYETSNYRLCVLILHRARNYSEYR